MSAPARAAGPRPREEGWENVAFIGVLGLLGVGLILWATGEISGFIATGQRPGTSFSEMGSVLLSLFEDPGDPKRAWPKTVRASMAGPVLFYATLVLLIFVAGAVGLGLHRIFKGSFSDGRRGSSWASLRDLRELIVKQPIVGRLVLGRVGSKLVAAEQRQSVIVLGPTQSMKTSGLAIPAILEWKGPVLATSVKSDLLANTIDARRRLGETVWVYDPTLSTGANRSGWSPLAFCESWHDAQRTASWLAGAAPSGSTGLSDAEFWYQAAAKLLAPLLYGAARSDRSIADVVRWINLQEQDEVLKALAGAEQGAIDAANASFKREGRQKSSVYTTAETVLAAYEDPVVSESAESCDITPQKLLEGSARTLYVVAPSHEQRRLRPLFETLLHTILSYVFERASQKGPLNPPLLVVLDEAANIAPLRDLDTLASTAASHGIQLVSVFQDLAQVTTRYGERAHTVVNNHRAKILLSGISDTQTLEYASRLLGDEEVLQSSITRGAQGSRSTTESMILRSLAPAHVLRGISPGEGVLVYGHLPPARLSLRPWFKEKYLLKLTS